MKRGIPFYLFQVMVRHTNRLAQNPDFQIVPASLWKYKEYEITKNNGKNFNKYERCIGLFQKLCKLYKNDPHIDIALCRYGMGGQEYDHCNYLYGFRILGNGCNHACE